MDHEDPTKHLSDPALANGRSADDLMEAVYTELRDLAEGYLRRERNDHVLQPTALVHEAYLKLVDQSRVTWQGRTHFKAIAAQAMRRLLIDHGRAEKRDKRGGGWHRVPLQDAYRLSESGELDALALQEALERMRELDERMAQVVQLRLFGGLSSEEAGRILEVSGRTVEREWKIAQAWLRRRLSKGNTE